MEKYKKSDCYFIKGTITDQHQKPVQGVMVEAYDWNPHTPENPLGKPDYTNEKGEYRIKYIDEDFRLGGKEKGGADLVIYVYNQDGKQIGKSETKFNASTTEQIDLTIQPTALVNGAPLDKLMEQFLKDEEANFIEVGGAKLKIEKRKQELEKLTEKLHQRGIFSREGLVETALKDFFIDEEAKKIGVSSLTLAGFIEYNMRMIQEKTLEKIREDVKKPKFTGNIDLDDPENEKIRKELRIDEIPFADLDEIKGWPKMPGIWIDESKVPKIPMSGDYSGPTAAVDLRPYLGDARNQNPRGTCTSFCATSIVEAMEYYRDPRNQPLDLSEELIFWYSKHGQLNTAGGYNGIAALRHYEEFGGCEETYLPYNKTAINSNYAHVPIPDIAIDRAQFYRNGKVVRLPAESMNNDVIPIKETLKTGRCVGISCDTDGWLSSTGEISMPDPPLEKKDIGAGHCVAIIGFIDRNDLHPDLEGGFFIVRNSWGYANDPSNLLGAEYGGHLLMPYGWYRRYAKSPFTMKDIDGRENEKRNWLIEYYDNKNLRGKPLDTVSIKIPPYWSTVEAPVPTEIDELDFDWQDGSALRFEFDTFPFSLPLKDNFSIRFTKLKRFEEGYYRFRLRGDDGVRLYVDDRLVINAWKVQGATSYVAVHHLTGGDHILKVEYYEKTGDAMVSLEMEAIPFTYQLFANYTLSGDPVRTFKDTKTHLEWRHAPPVLTSISPGTFSIRGNGLFWFKSGYYRFHALHNGGCQIRVDGLLVFDDLSGTNARGRRVFLMKGTYDVQVEYRYRGGIPAIGSKSYYKAELYFGWSEEYWLMDLYHDPGRKTLYDQDFPNPDSHYEAFRTHALTGRSKLQHLLDDPAISNSWSLNFNDIEEDLLKSIPAASEMSSEYLSLHIRRQVFIEEDGYYNAKLECDDGYRLCVDGKQVLEDHHITGSDPQNQDMWLKAGFHDISVEYANIKWGGHLKFNLEKASWKVTYYEGTNFETEKETKHVNHLSEVISSLPESMEAHTFSARATRSLWLPLGRYRFQLRGDDGVRLKVNGLTIIDGWTVQSPTSYHTYYEHQGGNIELEVEYFENSGGEFLDFQMIPEGYFGEYYRGITLNKVADGATLDRNVPIAYRFEPMIDFDWGAGNRLARVGSDNFSARWYGKVPLPVGRYRIELTADDGVRLFMNGRMVIDEWHTQNAKTHTKTIDLVGRLHDIKLEYFEQSKNAVCKLVFIREF